MMSEEDIKRVNEAYARNGLEQDPLNDLADTFKGLIAFIFVVVGLTMVAFAVWGK
jgi:hypothetical protein